MMVNPYFGERKDDERILFGWKKDDRIWGRANGWCRELYNIYIYI